MVNEEDHLRIQAMRSGLQVDAAWEHVNSIDDALESQLDYEYHPQFGYLTACPTNVAPASGSRSCCTCRPCG